MINHINWAVILLSLLASSTVAFTATSSVLPTCTRTSNSGESAFVRLPLDSKRLLARQYTVTVKMSVSDKSDGPPRLLVSNLHHLGSSVDGDDKIRLILASQSPRRREILDMLGLSGLYTATPSPLDESAVQSELLNSNTSVSPIDYTRTLAEKKAEALAEALSQDSNTKSTLILGSDTIVDLDGSILEKPTDEEAATSMLSRLSGNWHKVHTGVAIYHAQGVNTNLLVSFTDTAAVKFASLSNDDIEAYVATNEPMDKAGSYGIQGVGGQLVERMEGDFFTVMGLPMHRTSRELSRAISELRK